MKNNIILCILLVCISTSCDFVTKYAYESKDSINYVIKCDYCEYADESLKLAIQEAIQSMPYSPYIVLQHMETQQDIISFTGNLDTCRVVGKYDIQITGWDPCKSRGGYAMFEYVKQCTVISGQTCLFCETALPDDSLLCKKGKKKVIRFSIPCDVGYNRLAFPHVFLMKDSVNAYNIVDLSNNPEDDFICGDVSITF